MLQHGTSTVPPVKSWVLATLGTVSALQLKQSGNKLTQVSFSTTSLMDVIVPAGFWGCV
jgi:hypothetical protein